MDLENTWVQLSENISLSTVHPKKEVEICAYLFHVACVDGFHVLFNPLREYFNDHRLNPQLAGKGKDQNTNLCYVRQLPTTHTLFPVLGDLVTVSDHASRSEHRVVVSPFFHGNDESRINNVLVFSPKSDLRTVRKS